MRSLLRREVELAGLLLLDERYDLFALMLTSWEVGRAKCDLTVKYWTKPDDGTGYVYVYAGSTTSVDLMKQKMKSVFSFSL